MNIKMYVKIGCNKLKNAVSASSAFLSLGKDLHLVFLQTFGSRNQHRDNQDSSTHCSLSKNAKMYTKYTKKVVY